MRPVPAFGGRFSDLLQTNGQQALFRGARDSQDVPTNTHRATRRESGTGLRNWNNNLDVPFGQALQNAIVTTTRARTSARFWSAPAPAALFPSSGPQPRVAPISGSNPNSLLLLPGGLANLFLMRTVTSLKGMQRLAKLWKAGQKPVGLVPTMGYLHEGHLDLVRQARQQVGPSGVVVVSIYVNPTQFGPCEDLGRYPRDLARDQRLCRQAGVDVVFSPNDQEMYPGREAGGYSTYVAEELLSRSMEGMARPTHFRGVTTVVAKLFSIVQPDVAVFGAKDFQQAAIVRRMTGNLNFPARIVVAPTRREPDGLAMSSRNKYLEGDLRGQALALWQSIVKARKAVRQARRPVTAGRLRKQLARFIESHPAARLDYIEFFDPDTLQPVSRLQRGTQMALAVFVGKTRLIDNARL